MTRDRHMMGAGSAHFTLADSGHREVAPERLQMLGKRASALFVEKGIPLTDAVVNVLNDESGLNKQHVHRVTEFANNYAFEDMFNKEASDHRVIDFGEDGPADSAAILKELNSMGKEQIKTASARPSAPRRRFIPGQESAADQYGSMSKTASAGSEMYPYVDPYRELGDLRADVKRAHEEMLTKVADSGMEYEAAATELYSLTKQAVLSGHSPAEIAILFEQRAPHLTMVKLALKEIATRMEGDNIPAVPMQKVAGKRVANADHPLLRSFDTFVKIAARYFTNIAASEKLAGQFRKVDRKLRDMVQ